MQTHISEIAENTFSLTLRPPGSFISFNHFLILDSSPTLIHTGHNKTFNTVKELVAKLIDPTLIRYICFSHYEPDECGSLNQWYETAPNAEACVNKICESSLKDSSTKPSKILKDGDTLNLGSHILSFIETPHFPHAWEATMFLDTQTKTLFSSDLGTQQGFPQLKGDSVDIENIVHIQNKLGYMPYGPDLADGINLVKQLNFEIMATMHGNCLNRAKSMELLQALEQENIIKVKR